MIDVGNAYLNAECREKLYSYAGPEFGDDEGKLLIIVRAIYGLRSLGAAFRDHFATNLADLDLDQVTTLWASSSTYSTQKTEGSYLENPGKS